MQPPQAPLATFIRQHLELIINDWERVASTMQPAARYLDACELRNYAAEMLTRIAEEMETGQTGEQQMQKSRGQLPGHAPGVTTSAHDHAAHRLSAAFTLEQLVAEFRALRASVVRHWTDQLIQIGQRELEQLIRFNEGIDQLLTESIVWYDRMIRITQRRLSSVGVPEPPPSLRIRVADHSPAPTLVEVHGAFVYANAAAARLLGAPSPEAIVGRQVAELVEPDARSSMHEFLELVRSGQAAPLTDFRWRTVDGSELRVEVAAGLAPWKGPDGVEMVVCAKK